MGFLDKLLGRKKGATAEDMQTAPEPASMPAAEPSERLRDEGEQTQEPTEEQEGTTP